MGPRVVQSRLTSYKVGLSRACPSAGSRPRTSPRPTRNRLGLFRSAPRGSVRSLLHSPKRVCFVIRAGCALDVDHNMFRGTSDAKLTAGVGVVNRFFIRKGPPRKVYPPPWRVLPPYCRVTTRHGGGSLPAILAGYCPPRWRVISDILAAEVNTFWIGITSAPVGSGCSQRLAQSAMSFARLATSFVRK